jgi:hypothetical protein
MSAQPDQFIHVISSSSPTLGATHLSAQRICQHNVYEQRRQQFDSQQSTVSIARLVSELYHSESMTQVESTCEAQNGRAESPLSALMTQSRGSC